MPKINPSEYGINVLRRPRKPLKLKKTGYYIVNTRNLLDVSIIKLRFLTRTAAKQFIGRNLGADYDHHKIFKAKKAKKFYMAHLKVRNKFYSKYGLPPNGHRLTRQQRKNLRTHMRVKLFGRKVRRNKYSHHCDNCGKSVEWLPKFAQIRDYLILGMKLRICDKCHEKRKPKDP